MFSSQWVGVDQWKGKKKKKKKTFVKIAASVGFPNSIALPTSFLLKDRN